MRDPSSRCETHLALLGADVAEIRRILFGDGKKHKGLIDKVQRLAKSVDQGRFIRRVALWCAAIIVIMATGIMQLKQMFLEISTDDYLHSGRVERLWV